MTNNVCKCETALFSLDYAESAWQKKTNVMQSLPIFLGVRYDRRLILGDHVRRLCQSMSGCIKFFRALCGTTWGLLTSDWHLVYFAIVRSLFEYAARAPWLSATYTSKLEKVQLKAARAFNDLACSTTFEAVYVESQLPHISTRFITISFQDLSIGPIFHQPTIVVKPSLPHADSA